MELKDTGKELLAYGRPHWKMFASAFAFFTIGAAVEPIIPALLKTLIDSGFKEGLNYPLWLVPIVVIGLFALRGFFNFAGNYVMTSGVSSVVLSLRRALMRALLTADASLFSVISPGLAVTKIITDPQMASQSIGGSLISVIKDAMSLMFLVGYLLYLNWQLTLLSFICMPLLGITIKKVQQRLNKVGQAQYEAQQRLVNVVDDNARAWRVVRTFDASQFELQRFDSHAQTLRRMVLKTMATSSLITPLTQVVAAVGVSIIITLAIHQASQGATTVGEFVSFITALLMTISPMRHLTDIYQPITGALITMRGAFEIIRTPPEPDHGTLTLPHCAGDIVFDNVSVHYEGAAMPSLRGFNLHIQPGQTVALVGASGAGKTTVVNTLLRFAHVAEGQIRLDGIPTEELTLASLRQHFAVVSQDIVLFDGSVAQNIAYASPLGVDRAKVEHCLRAANLWSHVSTMAQGMDTGIGTNGSMLSGGQRQRLAIARALYRDAAIWVFDEATSALDSESETVVQRSIDEWRHEKTLILIAHRLSTIRNADVICVMSEGTIIEQGTHRELVERGGAYAHMVRVQMSA